MTFKSGLERGEGINHETICLKIVSGRWTTKAKVLRHTLARYALRTVKRPVVELE